MKIPKAIKSSRLFKFVFGYDGFPAFVFKETFRDIVYVFLKLENVLLRRRILRLDRRVRSLKGNQFVSVSHPVEQSMCQHRGDSRGNDRGGVYGRIDGHQCIDSVVTKAAISILANDPDHGDRKESNE